MSTEFKEAVTRLPEFVRLPLLRIETTTQDKIQEIHLRCERPIILTTVCDSLLLTQQGIADENNEVQPIYLSMQDIETCFLSLCNQAVYAYEDELKNGFLTLPGGHRVGIAGTAVYRENALHGVTKITSLCIRVAHRQENALDTRLKDLLQADFPRLLMIGPPCSGKTTLLKQIISFLSDIGRKISVIDERMELCPCLSKSKLPIHLDVLSGYKKHQGMEIALRSLSPDIILCDEVGNQKEVLQLEECLHSGIGFIATIHASSAEDLQYRPQIKLLMSHHVFEHLVLLHGKEFPGKIKGIYHVTDLT